MTFGAHNLVHSEPFWDYLYEICIGPKLMRGIFFKSLSYLYEVVHTYFYAAFWTFRKF